MLQKQLDNARLASSVLPLLLTKHVSKNSNSSKCGNHQTEPSVTSSMEQSSANQSSSRTFPALSQDGPSPSSLEDMPSVTNTEQPTLLSRSPANWSWSSLLLMEAQWRHTTFTISQEVESPWECTTWMNQFKPLEMHVSNTPSPETILFICQPRIPF